MKSPKLVASTFSFRLAPVTNGIAETNTRVWGAGERRQQQLNLVRRERSSATRGERSSGLAMMRRRSNHIQYVKRGRRRDFSPHPKKTLLFLFWDTQSTEIYEIYNYMHVADQEHPITPLTIIATMFEFLSLGSMHVEHLFQRSLRHTIVSKNKILLRLFNLPKYHRDTDSLRSNFITGLVVLSFTKNKHLEIILEEFIHIRHSDLRYSKRCQLLNGATNRR
mmetsp:Transcript_3947/g.8944  ORF Transcript_3947/g.8944 Transcript_3947/m.8944 type:complete len:222 (+) Transcript_3947:175-840(+)